VSEICDRCSMRTKDEVQELVLCAAEQIFHFGDSEAVVLDDCFANALQVCGYRTFTDWVFGCALTRVPTGYGEFLIPEKGTELSTFLTLTEKTGRVLKVVNRNSRCAQEYGLKTCIKEEHPNETPQEA
jgi:hypothetical protein